MDSVLVEQGLQTTAREVITSDPQRHFATSEKRILTKNFWLGRI